MSKNSLFIKSVSILISLVFGVSTINPQAAQAQTVPSLALPSAIVQPTIAHPAVLKGMTIHPEKPFHFDFIIDPGEENLAGEELAAETEMLVKYFLAALTVPEEDVWVNLNPAEHDRVIPDEFGQTDMGRDLLAQDFILKQLTASLLNPDKDIGAKMWKRIYDQVETQYGARDIPINLLNKVWIVPEESKIFVNENNVFVVDSKLKVMLEEEYERVTQQGDRVDGQTYDIIHDIIIPALEHEVNHGSHFTKLRQIFHSMILATWYKKNLKQSVLTQKYADQNKMQGIEATDKDTPEKIYIKYLEAFKSGVHNIIKEEYDPVTQDVVTRRFFTGGVDAAMLDETFTDATARAVQFASAPQRAVVTLEDAAMKAVPVLDEERMIARLREVFLEKPDYVNPRPSLIIFPKDASRFMFLTQKKTDVIKVDHKYLLKNTEYRSDSTGTTEVDWFRIDIEYGSSGVVKINVLPPSTKNPRDTHEKILEFQGVQRDQLPITWDDQWSAYQRDGLIQIARLLRKVLKGNTKGLEFEYPPEVFPEIEQKSEDEIDDIANLELAAAMTTASPEVTDAAMGVAIVDEAIRQENERFNNRRAAINQLVVSNREDNFHNSGHQARVLEAIRQLDLSTNLAERKFFNPFVWAQLGAIRRVVNSQAAEELTAVYLGSGADISGFFQATGATNGIFVDITSINFENLQKYLSEKEKWEELDVIESDDQIDQHGRMTWQKEYFKNKFEAGWGSSGQHSMDNLAGKIALELKMLGVNRTSVTVNQPEEGVVVIEFMWNGKKRTITYIEGDLSRSKEFHPRIQSVQGQVDIVLMRSGYSLAYYYENFLARTFDLLKTYGFLVTDNYFHLVDEQFARPPNGVIIRNYHYSFYAYSDPDRFLPSNQRPIKTYEMDYMRDFFLTQHLKVVDRNKSGNDFQVGGLDREERYDEYYRELVPKLRADYPALIPQDYEAYLYGRALEIRQKLSAAAMTASPPEVTVYPEASRGDAAMSVPAAPVDADIGTGVGVMVADQLVENEGEGDPDDLEPINLKDDVQEQLLHMDQFLGETTEATPIREVRNGLNEYVYRMTANLNQLARDNPRAFKDNVQKTKTIVFYLNRIKFDLGASLPGKVSFFDYKRSTKSDPNRLKLIIDAENPSNWMLVISVGGKLYVRTSHKRTWKRVRVPEGKKGIKKDDLFSNLQVVNFHDRVLENYFNIYENRLAYIRDVQAQAEEYKDSGVIQMTPVATFSDQVRRTQIALPQMNVTENDEEVKENVWAFLPGEVSQVREVSRYTSVFLDKNNPENSLFVVQTELNGALVYLGPNAKSNAPYVKPGDAPTVHDELVNTFFLQQLRDHQFDENWITPEGESESLLKFGNAQPIYVRINKNQNTDLRLLRAGLNTVLGLVESAIYTQGEEDVLYLYYPNEEEVILDAGGEYYDPNQSVIIFQRTGEKRVELQKFVRNLKYKGYGTRAIENILAEVDEGFSGKYTALESSERRWIPSARGWKQRNVIYVVRKNSKEESRLRRRIAKQQKQGWIKDMMFAAQPILHNEYITAKLHEELAEESEQLNRHWMSKVWGSYQRLKDALQAQLRIELERQYDELTFEQREELRQEFRRQEWLQDTFDGVLEVSQEYKDLEGRFEVVCQEADRFRKNDLGQYEDRIIALVSHSTKSINALHRQFVQEVRAAQGDDDFNVVVGTFRSKIDSLIKAGRIVGYTGRGAKPSVLDEYEEELIALVAEHGSEETLRELWERFVIRYRHVNFKKVFAPRVVSMPGYVSKRGQRQKKPRLDAYEKEIRALIAEYGDDEIYGELYVRFMDLYGDRVKVGLGTFEGYVRNLPDSGYIPKSGRSKGGEYGKREIPRAIDDAFLEPVDLTDREVRTQLARILRGDRAAQAELAESLMWIVREETEKQRESYEGPRRWDRDGKTDYYYESFSVGFLMIYYNLEVLALKKNINTAQALKYKIRRIIKSRLFESKYRVEQARSLYPKSEQNPYGEGSDSDDTWTSIAPDPNAGKGYRIVDAMDEVRHSGEDTIYGLINAFEAEHARQRRRTQEARERLRQERLEQLERDHQTTIGGQFLAADRFLSPEDRELMRLFREDEHEAQKSESEEVGIEEHEEDSQAAAMTASSPEVTSKVEQITNTGVTIAEWAPYAIGAAVLILVGALVVFFRVIYPQVRREAEEMKEDRRRQSQYNRESQTILSQLDEIPMEERLRYLVAVLTYDPEWSGDENKEKRLYLLDKVYLQFPDISEVYLGALMVGRGNYLAAARQRVKTGPIEQRAALKKEEGISSLVGVVANQEDVPTHDWEFIYFKEQGQEDTYTGIFYLIGYTRDPRFPSEIRPYFIRYQPWSVIDGLQNALIGREQSQESISKVMAVIVEDNLRDILRRRLNWSFTDFSEFISAIKKPHINLFMVISNLLLDKHYMLDDDVIEVIFAADKLKPMLIDEASIFDDPLSIKNRIGLLGIYLTELQKLLEEYDIDELDIDKFEEEVKLSVPPESYLKVVELHRFFFGNEAMTSSSLEVTVYPERSRGDAAMSAPPKRIKQYTQEEIKRGDPWLDWIARDAAAEELNDRQVAFGFLVSLFHHRKRLEEMNRVRLRIDQSKIENLPQFDVVPPFTVNVIGPIIEQLLKKWPNDSHGHLYLWLDFAKNSIFVQEYKKGQRQLTQDFIDSAKVLNALPVSDNEEKMYKNQHAVLQLASHIHFFSEHSPENYRRSNTSSRLTKGYADVEVLVSMGFNLAEYFFTHQQDQDPSLERTVSVLALAAALDPNAYLGKLTDRNTFLTELVKRFGKDRVARLIKEISTNPWKTWGVQDPWTVINRDLLKVDFLHVEYSRQLIQFTDNPLGHPYEYGDSVNFYRHPLANYVTRPSEERTKKAFQSVSREATTDNHHLVPSKLPVETRAAQYTETIQRDLRLFDSETNRREELLRLLDSSEKDDVELAIKWLDAVSSQEEFNAILDELFSRREWQFHSQIEEDILHARINTRDGETLESMSWKKIDDSRLEILANRIEQNSEEELPDTHFLVELLRRKVSVDPNPINARFVQGKHEIGLGQEHEAAFSLFQDEAIYFYGFITAVQGGITHHGTFPDWNKERDSWQAHSYVEHYDDVIEVEFRGNMWSKSDRLLIHIGKELSLTGLMTLIGVLNSLYGWDKRNGSAGPNDIDSLIYLNGQNVTALQQTTILHSGDVVRLADNEQGALAAAMTTDTPAAEESDGAMTRRVKQQHIEFFENIPKYRSLTYAEAAERSLGLKNVDRNKFWSTAVNLGSPDGGKTYFGLTALHAFEDPGKLYNLALNDTDTPIRLLRKRPWNPDIALFAFNGRDLGLAQEGFRISRSPFLRNDRTTVMFDERIDAKTPLEHKVSDRLSLVSAPEIASKLQIKSRLSKGNWKETIGGEGVSNPGASGSGIWMEEPSGERLRLFSIYHTTMQIGETQTPFYGWTEWASVGGTNPKEINGVIKDYVNSLRASLERNAAMTTSSPKITDAAMKSGVDEFRDRIAELGFEFDFDDGENMKIPGKRSQRIKALLNNMFSLKDGNNNVIGTAPILLNDLSFSGITVDMVKKREFIIYLLISLALLLGSGQVIFNEDSNFGQKLFAFLSAIVTSGTMGGYILGTYYQSLGTPLLDSLFLEGNMIETHFGAIFDKSISLDLDVEVLERLQKFKNEGNEVILTTKEGFVLWPEELEDGRKRLWINIGFLYSFRKFIYRHSILSEFTLIFDAIMNMVEDPSSYLKSDSVNEPNADDPADAAMRSTLAFQIFKKRILEHRREFKRFLWGGKPIIEKREPVQGGYEYKVQKRSLVFPVEIKSALYEALFKRSEFREAVTQRLSQNLGVEHISAADPIIMRAEKLKSHQVGIMRWNIVLADRKKGHFILAIQRKSAGKYELVLELYLPQASDAEIHEFGLAFSDLQRLTQYLFQILPQGDDLTQQGLWWPHGVQVPMSNGKGARILFRGNALTRRAADQVMADVLLNSEDFHKRLSSQMFPGENVRVGNVMRVTSDEKYQGLSWRMFHNGVPVQYRMQLMPLDLPNDNYYELHLEVKFDILDLPDQEASDLRSHVEESFTIVQNVANEMVGYDANGAMTAVEETPGGIDMNPAHMRMEQEGDIFDVPVPNTFEEFQNMQINGLVPVIHSITPVTNLPMLLGLSDEDESMDLTFPVQESDQEIIEKHDAFFREMELSRAD